MQREPEPTAMTDRTITALADTLMRAVVRSGAMRTDTPHHEADVALAVSIMREELKAFLFDAKYADERALAMVGQDNLALQSLAAECVSRLVKERATEMAAD